MDYYHGSFIPHQAELRPFEGKGRAFLCPYKG